tara:strand:- start:5664 stop:7754 length:2091 start_codon:yes stop_codon:yes gene_type:complete
MTKLTPRLRPLARFLLTTTALVAVAPALAQAASLVDLETLGTNSVAYAISGDGSTVVGSTDVGQFTAYFWNDADGMTGLSSLGGVPGTCGSAANAVNADGSVIVGYSAGGAQTYAAVRWDGLAITELTNGYASTSEATGVSGDGDVIVGNRDNGGTNEAFVWTSGSGAMSDLSGVVGESYAYAVSSDGVYVGGASDVSGTQVAMRWSSGDGLETLGTIDGFAGYSYTYALSADGSVATGFSQTAGGNQAFRWVDGSGMTGLGTLAGGDASYGQALSAGGNVIVGFSDSSGTHTAFRWTEILGMESLVDILEASDVDTTGWTLDEARGVSADGLLIVGTGTFGGTDHAFLMTSDALITPEEFAASLAPTSAPGAQSQGMFGNFVTQLFSTTRNIISTYFGQGFQKTGSLPVLYAANDTGVMSDASPAPRGLRTAVYATGSFGIGKFDDYSNSTLNGTTGVLLGVSDELAFGVGVLGNRADQDTHLDGDVRTNALGGSVSVAYEPASGLRLYGLAALARLDVKTDRHYLNGAAVDASRGETDGYGYALAARAGYEFPLNADINLMPYAELEWDRTVLDAYTETGGGIPATVGEQNDHRFVSRVGAEASTKLGDDTVARLRGAWGHRLSGGNGAVQVTALGIGQSIRSGGSEDDWAEAGVSLTHDVNRDLTLSANLDTRLANAASRDATLTLGLVYRLN